MKKKLKCNRKKVEMKIDWSNIIFEVIFYILNFVNIFSFISTNKIGLQKIPKELVFLCISLIINLVIVIKIRHIIPNERGDFHILGYYANLAFYTYFAMSANEGIFLANDIPSNIFTIFALVFIILDFLNYFIFDNYSFIVIFLLFIIIIFISMSIDESSFSIALGFITFIFSITDNNVLERLFKIDEVKLSETKMLDFKLLSIILLLTVFFVMSISKYILIVYLKSIGSSIDQLSLSEFIKYGSYRFFAFSIIISIAYYFRDGIKKIVGKFLVNNFSE